MIGKTVVHLGKKLSIRHNTDMEFRKQEAERELSKDKQSHIDINKIQYNKVIINHPVTQLFDDIFGDALMDYNQKTCANHPERLIGYSYKMYKHLMDTGNTKKIRDKAVATYYDQQKKNIQECIIQMSNATNYNQLIADVGEEQARRIHAEFLQRSYDDWEKSNPSLKVISATMHFDETTPHMHLDFIPVGKSTRGLTCKVSIDGALSELGYKRNKSQSYNEIPYKAWLKSLRERVDNIASSYMDILHSDPSTKGHTEYYKHKYDVAEINGLNKLITMFNANPTIKNAKTIVDKVNAINCTCEKIIQEAQAKQEQIHKKEKYLDTLENDLIMKMHKAKILLANAEWEAISRYNKLLANNPSLIAKQRAERNQDYINHHKNIEGEITDGQSITAQYNKHKGSSTNYNINQYDKKRTNNTSHTKKPKRDGDTISLG